MRVYTLFCRLFRMILLLRVHLIRNFFFDYVIVLGVNALMRAHLLLRRLYFRFGSRLLVILRFLRVDVVVQFRWATSWLGGRICCFASYWLFLNLWGSGRLSNRMKVSLRREFGCRRLIWLCLGCRALSTQAVLRRVSSWQDAGDKLTRCRAL